MIPRRAYSLVCSFRKSVRPRHIIPTPPTYRGLRPFRLSSSSAHAFQQDDHEFPSTTSQLTSLPETRPSIVQTDDKASKTILRDYQEDAIQKCLEALSSGLTRIGVSSPTASGKTTMFMHLIPRVQSIHEPQGDRGRTLILVGSVELANQAEGAARRLLGPEWSVEVEQASRRASGQADITIATYQTLNNVERLRKFDPRLFKLVIVDEAHHAAALSYLRMLHYFNQDVELPEIMAPVESADHGNRVPIVGFSATFSRADQLALSAVFQKIVYHRGLVDMLDEGWLSPVKSTAVKCDLNLRTVELNSQGDFNTTSLASHLNTPNVNNLIVATYLHRASDRRSTLIFCVDLTHVADLTRTFREAGIDARSVSSLSRPLDRRDTIKGFSEGEFPVLINCEVLTEGTDIPVIDCIILARPTKSKNLLTQMVGRGLRLSADTGKTDCYLIDIVDNVSRSNGMLVSPTLWGLSHDDAKPDRKEKSEEAGGGTEESKTGGEEGSGAGGGNMAGMKVTYIDQDDPFRLAKKGGTPLARMSHNAWVFCGKNRYILELFDQGYILVAPPTEKKPDQPEWAITYRQKLPYYLQVPAFFSKVKSVAVADTLERALQTADKFAERKVGREVYEKLSRYAAWRQRPPSPKALDMVLIMKGEAVRDDTGKIVEINMMGKRFEIGQITAGHVSSYLCAASHGGLTVRKAADSALQAKENRRLAKEDKAQKLAGRNLALPKS